MKKLPELRRKLSLRRGPHGPGGPPELPEPRNVLGRYHLDSSVAWPLTTAVSGRSGHRSDGDSPELRARPRRAPGGPHLDLGAFRPYGDPPPKCPAELSGLLGVRLRGLRPAWPERVCCVLQVDGESRARTSLLAGAAAFLRLEHRFRLDVERARSLRLAVLARGPSGGPARLLGHG
ncbi:rho GTPase-activating protein SYDE1-like, partial [Onychostruthus taczanowskii]|uniref:rho GTPase-activating protein SYDE1-like n=1 Tax=Onychostruthus taczanowskii TaxID=356909 RepID=UPI001B80163A